MFRIAEGRVRYAWAPCRLSMACATDLPAPGAAAAARHHHEECRRGEITCACRVAESLAYPSAA